jgi:hypothetical protein
MENTLLVVVPDNGASQEGRATGTFNEVCASTRFRRCGDEYEVD